MKLRIMKLAAALLAVPVLPLAIPLHLYAQSPLPSAWVGTWKFNPAKSKFPGTPPQADQVTVDPDGTISIQETNSQGKSSGWSYKPVQGKPVAVPGHGENVTVTATTVNPRKTEQVWDFNGRPAKSYATLSKDGKTQIFHMSGTGKDGKPFKELVFTTSSSRAPASVFLHKLK